jgi:hypothetical protein
MRRFLLSVVLVGLGAAGGYLLGSLRGPPPTAAPVVRGVVERQPVVIADRGLSEAELRRVVHEELAASGAAPRGAAAGEAAPPPPPADPVAYDDGMRRVGQAIAQRRWTPDDTAALDRTLEAVSPEQRTAILRVLVPALNRGEIKLTYRGAVF